jgi:hypothetical protein
VEAFEFETQTRIRVFAVGVMVAVVHDAASVVVPPPVNREAVTPAVAVPASRSSEQARITARTKERLSAAVLGLSLSALTPRPTWASTLAVRAARLHLSRSSIVREVSTDRATT